MHVAPEPPPGDFRERAMPGVERVERTGQHGQRLRVIDREHPVGRLTEQPATNPQVIGEWYRNRVHFVKQVQAVPVV